MKRDSIVKKLIVTFTAITGGILILVGLIISFFIYSISEKDKISMIEKQVEVLQQSIDSYLNQEDDAYDELKRILKMLSLATDMDAMLVDKLGYVYMVSSDNYNNLKYTNVDIPYDIINNIHRVGYTTSLFNSMDEDIEYYVKPVVGSSGVAGFAIMIKKERYFGHQLFMIIWVAIVIAMMISALIVNYFAKRLVIKPLEHINNGARRLAKGEVQKRVEVVSNDEIGELAESFNIMAEAIEESDNITKEFISNVSHELRSPITSIKGFVGGIVDGVIPKDKENYYLNIVYDEIDRLARLVNDLLDISAMESGKFNLVVSEFDINSVIKLCILNLEGKIQSKCLSLNATFSDNRCFVVADRDRVIQVLTNLLENAIKYSEDNGDIRVDIYSKGEKIYISIFNSGENISKEDINHIWDRFYKSDKSRTNKISTGLGLSIVRLILSQHNEDVWVKNIDGKGVTFIFTLMRAK